MPRQASMIFTEDEFKEILIPVRMAMDELSQVEGSDVKRYHVTMAQWYLERALKVLDGENVILD